MNLSKNAVKIVFTAKIIILIIFFASTAYAELKLGSAVPTLGLLGQELEVKLTGTGFNDNTGISMYMDAYNRTAIIGLLDTPGSADRVAVSGNYAYVADGAHGLQVVDISNPQNPELIHVVDISSYIDYSASSVTIFDDYAYVGFAVTEEICDPPPFDDYCEYIESGGLQVIDISNPSNSYVIGSLILVNWIVGESPHPHDIEVSGNYAYVTVFERLKVVDISDPTNPDVIGTVYGPNGNLSLSGHFLYSADISGLVVIDVSTPTSPQIVGEGLETRAADVVVSGNYAYVSESFNGGLQVVDISSPKNPQIIASTKTATYGRAIALLGDNAFMTTDNGVQVFDISNPSSPQFIGSVKTPCGSSDIAVEGGYAYVAGGCLQIIDIVTASNLWLVGWVDTPGWANDVVVAGNYAYVADSSVFQIVNISDPKNPQIVGSVPAVGARIFDVTIVDNYAYLAVGGSSPGSYFQVIDIRNPAAPKPIGSVNINTGFGLAVYGNYAYIADGPSGFKVIDISDRQTPRVVGSFPTPDWAFRVVVDGNYAYVTCNSKGLQILDIRNPSNPHIISSVENIGYPRGIAVVGDYAYVEGHVIDISNPRNPLDLGQSWAFGGTSPGGFDANNLIVIGNYLYAAGGTLEVFDITDPTRPKAFASIGSLDSAEGVAVRGDFVYVADQSCGLIILAKPVAIEPVTDNSDSETSIPVTLPSPIIAGHYTLRVFNATESDELPGAVSFTTDLQILQSKAIIVAGGGPNATGEIWEETKLAANKAYKILVHEGYDDDSILYLTNEIGSDNLVDGPSLRFRLDDAINTWATDASELVIFFVDHGLPDNFIIYEDDGSSEQLSVDELDDWLDNLQQNIIGPVTFIYDACHSGTFASKLVPPAGKERIVITGASDEAAHFQGEDSFSFRFWEQILLQGGNLGYAFSAAAYIMQGYQSALINADGDRLTNEDDDMSIANGMVLRRGQPIYLKQVPTIGNVVGAQTLTGSPSSTIWVSNVRVSDVVDTPNVWAKIIPPDIKQDVDGVPIPDLPSIQLQPSGNDGTYAGTYSGFTTAGTYTIIINAQITQDIFSYIQEAMVIPSSPVYTSVTQMKGPHNIKADSFEVDDTYPQANVIILNDLDVQSHNFHDLGDVDWVKFHGLSGQKYNIKAGSVSVICDVIIELFDSDGITRLSGPRKEAGNGKDEFLAWTCTRDDVYYVKLSNANATFGENCKYDLKLYRPIAPLSGFIKGTLKDELTGQELTDVRINTNSGASGLSRPSGGYLIVHPPGTYNLTAQKAGYMSKTIIDVPVSEGDFTSLDILLMPQSSVTKEVEAFVTRFYRLCLGRDPDEVGLTGWASALLDGTLTGSDVAYGFVFSPEFSGRNPTDEEYLQVLYEAFFNRQPDPAGWQGWIDAMLNGTSREDVLNGFIYAMEFAELCEKFCIEAFSGHVPRCQSEAVEAFVTRFYDLCLDRTPDIKGLQGWVNDLLNKIKTGADVAEGFVYSPEFSSKNTSNSEYLQILYKAFFNRDADQAGWDTWLVELNSGRDRGVVLNGFIYSQEFAALCHNFGIKAYDSVP